MFKFLLLISCAALPLFIQAQVSVLTQHNDLARTGANLAETQLNISNVNANEFGKLFSRNVDDQIYAQPLIVSGIAMPAAGMVDVVYVATVNNSVYAFNADDSLTNAPYWQISLTPAGTEVVKNTDMTGACGGNYFDFSGNIGIVSTPVIDTASKTIYLVSRDRVSSNGNFEQWLHAIDITTGNEKPFSPVLITATYSGNGDGNAGGIITFDPQKQNQRCALTLVNGVVYIAWASHCDWGPYHGWVIGYDASNFNQKYVWMDTPDGSDGGIWMSGQGLSADAAGNLYVSTGNGTVGTNSDPADTINRGESFLKLLPAGNSLHVESFFTPHNYNMLENNDLDLGSQGLLLIPNTNWAFSGGKEGRMYLVNRDTMGGVDVADHVMQEIDEGSGNQLHGGPVFWHSATADYVYVWAASQFMHAYYVNYATSQLDVPAAMTSNEFATTGQPGGMLSLSANGSTPGTGIIWAALPLSGDANQQTRPGILRAYDAADFSSELWDSQMNAQQDSIGAFAKFVCPTIANGKVYIATFSGQLVVYGLFNPSGTGEEINGSSNWVVYPNPARENITAGNLLSGYSRIAVADIYGRRILLRDIPPNSSSCNIDMSSFNRGIYFIEVLDKSGSVLSVQKLMLQ